MNSKKLSAVVLSAIMTLGLLTGCGSNATSDTASTSNTTTATTNKTEAPAAGVTEIEFFSTKTENATIMQKIVDDFNAANADVKVTLTTVADAGTVLKTRLTKDDIPEVIAMGGDSTYTEVQGAGVLLDLGGEAFISNITAEYLQMVYDVNANQEQVAYGIPYATNASGVLYNETLFAEAGVAVPTTWTEFVAAMETFKSKGIQPLELTFADAWTCLPPWNSMAPVIPAADFTSQRKVGATTFAGTHDEVMEKYLTLLGYAQEDFMGTTYNDGNVLFAQGQAAMMINGNWAVSEFLNANPDVKVNMFAFPSCDDASKNTVTSGVDVLLAASSKASAEEQAAAKRFIAYLCTAEVAQSYIDDQFAFSAVKGAVQTNATVAGVAKDIANGKVSNFPDHYYPNGFDLSAILQQAALDYVGGKDNAANIADTLAECDAQYDIANVG